jgi:hypothetical protein
MANQTPGNQGHDQFAFEQVLQRRHIE